MAEDSGDDRQHSEDEEDEGGDGSQEEKGGGASGAPVKSSHVIEEHIDIGVPRQVVYDQWTQYEDLSKYTKKESAEAKGDERISFTSKIGPSSRKWDTEVVEQEAPKRIAWRSVGGAQNMGVVTFHELDGRLTRVMVQMEYHPSGAMETVGNFLRMPRRRVRKNLKLFKHFIELRNEATGKGAGEVEGEGLAEQTDEHLGGEESDGGNNEDNGPRDEPDEARAS